MCLKTKTVYIHKVFMTEYVSFSFFIQVPVVCDNGQRVAKGTSAPPPTHLLWRGLWVICSMYELGFDPDNQCNNVYCHRVIQGVRGGCRVGPLRPRYNLVHQRASDAIKKALIVVQKSHRYNKGGAVRK